MRTVESRAGEVFDCTIDLFDAQADPFPYPSHYFDTVVCGELLEHLQSDPMHMMSEVYRVLKPDGILVLTTPNAVSMRALMAMLAARLPDSTVATRIAARSSAGTPASILRRRSPNCWPPPVSWWCTSKPARTARKSAAPIGRGRRPGHEGLAKDLRGDCIFAVGRKAALARSRYPPWLYDSEGAVAK